MLHILAAVLLVFGLWLLLPSLGDALGMYGESPAPAPYTLAALGVGVCLLAAVVWRRARRPAASS